MGQVNRVDSCRLAVERAGDRAAGSVAASDAFFPFADGLQILIDAGVRAIVQPGGSVRDERGRRGRRGGRRHDVPHRHPALLPLSPSPRRMMDDPVTAQILDGTATAEGDQGRAHRPGRRAARAAASCPGSAPCWSATTRARTGTSAASTRTAPRSASPRSGVDLPATATQAEVEARDRRAERRPGLHRLHRPAAAAAALDENRVLGLVDPAKDADGLHPTNLGRLVLGEAGAAAVHAASASSSCCAATASQIAGAEVVVVGRGRHRRAARSGCCSPGAPRTPP